MAGFGFDFDSPSMLFVRDAHAMGRLWNLSPSFDFDSPLLPGVPANKESSAGVLLSYEGSI
jgi:hypothetical protein